MTFLAFLEVCPGLVCAELELFVSPSGDDAASGEAREAPLRTLAAAVSRVRAAGGGTLWVFPGTYTEPEETFPIKLPARTRIAALDQEAKPAIGFTRVNSVFWIEDIPRERASTRRTRRPPTSSRSTWPGAGPRACQFLVLGAKAKALLSGRFHASVEDIQAVAHPVLRHRILTNFHAEAKGFGADKIIEKLLETTPAEEGAILPDGQLRKVLRS